MNPAILEARIYGEDGIDPLRLKLVQDEATRLISLGKKVIVRIEQGKGGEEHLSQVRKYTQDVRSLKEQISRINSMVVIASLRSVGIPTHTEPVSREKKAIEILRQEKYLLAAVL